MHYPFFVAVTCVCVSVYVAQIAVIVAGCLLALMVWWRGLLSDSMQKTAGIILFAASASMLSSNASSQSARQAAIESRYGDAACNYLCSPTVYAELVKHPLHYGLIVLGAFGATIIFLIVMARIVGAMRGRN